MLSLTFLPGVALATWFIRLAAQTHRLLINPQN